MSSRVSALNDGSELVDVSTPDDIPIGADAPLPMSSMSGDRPVGDGGNLTVFERPDGSMYALDKHGRGVEWDPEAPLFGRARFDSRHLSTGRWEGSRSIPRVWTENGTPGSGSRARRHSGRFKTGG